jgi:hypothetical protein
MTRRTFRNKETGSAILLMELVGLIVAVTIFSMSAPLLSGLKKAHDQRTVVELLRRVQYAELYHTQIYQDGFRSPSALSATRTFPATCEASGLLDGTAALPSYTGYSLIFTFTGAQIAPAPGCTSGGFQGFTLIAAPNNYRDNQRYFYLSSTDLVLRYQDGQAGPSSAPWTAN